MKLQKFKKLKMTFEQFARLIESDAELIEHWTDTRGREFPTMLEDVTSYITEYEDGKHGNRADIMYWLLVEMNVIDPDTDEVEELVQKFVDTPV